MPFYNRKRRGDSSASSYPTSKRTRTAGGAGGSFGSGSAGGDGITLGGAAVDDEGNTYWEISNSRRVTVSEFKGKTYIGIREYFEKDGRQLPGKKGISLSVEQFSSLINILPQLDASLAAVGQRIPRPNYDGLPSNLGPQSSAPTLASIKSSSAAAGAGAAATPEKSSSQSEKLTKKNKSPKSARKAAEENDESVSVGSKGKGKNGAQDAGADDDEDEEEKLRRIEAELGMDDDDGDEEDEDAEEVGEEEYEDEKVTTSGKNAHPGDDEESEEE